MFEKIWDLTGELSEVLEKELTSDNMNEEYMSKITKMHASLQEFYGYVYSRFYIDLDTTNETDKQEE